MIRFIAGLCSIVPTRIAGASGWVTNPAFRWRNPRRQRAQSTSLRAIAAPPRLLLTVLLASLLVGCSGKHKADPYAEANFSTEGTIAYQAKLIDLPNKELEQLLEASLKLYTLADRPPAACAACPAELYQ